MSDVEKAAQDAAEAARQGETYALFLAALEAARQQPPACHHQTPAPVRPSGSPGKWLAIGAAGSVVGIAFALSAIAVAVSAVALTVCLLVLRGMWADYQRDREKREQRG